jgi:RND family efflux transporter MFP subunit
MNKKTVVISVAAILIILLWIIIRSAGQSGNNSQRNNKPSVAVEVDSIRIASVTETRSLTGTVVPHSRYIISPKVAGRLMHIRKRIGDAVSAGEVVARLDNEEYFQAVKEAEANLNVTQATLLQAESALELAGQDLKRAKSLQEKGISSSAELDAALTQFSASEAGLKLAHAQMASRQSSLDLARIRLGYTNLTSSSSGFIGERFVDEGALLTANTPVFSVVTFDKVYIRTSIVERDYSRIQTGMKAVIEVDAYPGQYFYGAVARIAPVIEQNSRNAEVELEVPNDSLLLKPGMFARVNLELQHKERAQLAPSQAVMQLDGKRGVFIINNEESTVSFIPVTTGIVNTDFTEIIDPELNGLVVTLGQHLLKDGSQVILPGSSETLDSKSKSSGKKQ